MRRWRRWPRGNCVRVGEIRQLQILASSDRFSFISHSGLTEPYPPSCSLSCSVELRTLAQALRRVPAGTGVLIVCADVAPPIGVSDAMRALTPNGCSAALVHRTSAAAAAGSMALGPAAMAVDVAAGKVTAVRSGAGAVAGSPVASAFFLSAADAADIATSAVHARLRAEASASSAAGASAGAAPPPPLCELSLSVPLEAGLAWLAAAGRLLEVPVVPATVASPAPACAPAVLRPAIRRRCCARVGLLGNPSDGYHGKTLSTTVRCAVRVKRDRAAFRLLPTFIFFPRSFDAQHVQIANFAAVVDLVPNADPSDESIRLLPHAIYDALTFTNLPQLSAFCGRDGYSGACW